MSNRTKAPTFRLQIQQLYEAEVVNKGSNYSLKSDTGLFYHDIMICGIITEFEPKNQDKGIFKVLLDDTTGSIWIDVQNYKFKDKLSLWKSFEIYGTIQAAKSSNNTFELSLVPHAIIPIMDPQKELLHALDASYQTLHAKEIFARYENVDNITVEPEYSEGSQQRFSQHTGNDEEEFFYTEDADNNFSGGMESNTDSNNTDENSSDSHTDIETQIIKIIRKEDSGKGVSFDSIREQLEKIKHLEISELEDVIFDLQMEGTIFEPTWRVYRLSE